VELRKEEVAVELIANETLLNDRPPDPRLLDRSSNKESQGPIDVGEMIVTTGIEGTAGPDTVTFIDGLHFQSPQPAEEEKEEHLAFTTDGFNINVSPMLTKPDEREEEDEREGCIMKLTSSNHTQRTDGSRYLDLNNKSQANPFNTPPRFVGESNSTNTLDPSLENIADFIKGGEGS
jgi:hypothetical protein